MLTSVTGLSRTKFLAAPLSQHVSKSINKSSNPTKIAVSRFCQNKFVYDTGYQGRIKGGATGAIAPSSRPQRVLPWWNLFVSNKILVWKISWFRSDTRIQLYIIFLCCVKYQGVKGPHQQLISLQVWLSASFSNRYWIAYKYFRFCSMQIYLVSLVTFFLLIVLLAWVWLSTRASRLLHKCHENVTICVLMLLVVGYCLVSINIATGVSLVNIRLLPFSTTHNIKFLRYSFQHHITSKFYATVSYTISYKCFY